MPPSEAGDPLPSDLDPEAQAVIEEDLWESRLEALEAEAVEPHRAKAMSARVAADYGSLIEKNNGRLGDVVCKETGCKLDIEWQAKADMKRGSNDALYARTTMSENCARHVRRDEETLRSTVIFECGDATGLDL